MAGLGFDFFGSLLSGGDIGESLINNIDPTGGKDIFGSRPEVADYVPVDLSAETGKAIAGNLKNYDAVTALLNKIIPNFSETVSTGMGNALSELRGELPDDVAAQIQRSSAYKALQGGYGGTGMSKALTARDLGLTSLNLTQMGNNTAQVWSQIAEGGYSPWEVSTGQQAGTTAENNAGIQGNKQLKFNVAASPDPAVAGHFALDQHIGDQFMSFGLGAAGGLIAGGGGTPQPSYAYDPRTGSYVPVSSSAPATSSDFRYNSTWGGGA